MTIQPELAESWTLSDDKLTWTFKLRQGVKFHDGQELTSDDVKFTFDRLLEKSAGGKADFTALDKVEPAGKHQVKFVTKEPFAALLAALAGFWAYIVSEAGVKAGRRRPQQDRDGHRPLHAGRLEGRAADGLQEEPELLQEGPALRRRGRDPDHPGRGEHRRRAPRRTDPPRLHRGQQELEPPEGREGAHGLPVLAPRLRLPQHQREPRQRAGRQALAPQGRPRPPGHQLRRRPERDPPGRRRRLRAADRARHRADEAVADPRGPVDEVLQARPRQGQEAPGRRRTSRTASPSSSASSRRSRRWSTGRRWSRRT